MNKFKNKIPIIAGILFLVTNIIAVLSAWITDIHPISKHRQVINGVVAYLG